MQRHGQSLQILPYMNDQADSYHAGEDRGSDMTGIIFVVVDGRFIGHLFVPQAERGEREKRSLLQPK